MTYDIRLVLTSLHLRSFNATKCLPLQFQLHGNQLVHWWAWFLHFYGANFLTGLLHESSGTATPATGLSPTP